ncbi:MAG TPA: hypothetical protein VGL72_25880 [Bryobacteraceae bacterium]|jgi:hypothetical protein
MATEKQILANRRNGQMSTGPRTAEGKSVSRLNALRHGLTGQIDVRTPEEQAAHGQFCDAIIASLKPEGALEHQFALSIADDHWRLNRGRSLEQNIFAITATFHNSDGAMETTDLDTALAYARTYIADPSRLNLLSIYERRIHGNMSRSLKQLMDLQAIRHAARAKAFEEEALLAQLAESQEIPYNPADFPAENGFVFSEAQIRRAIRLQQARGAGTHPRGGGFSHRSPSA